MKRPLQLPLAIVLALGGVNAFALGLGTIQVRSGLNQPLNAEIPIIQSNPGEAEGLIVQLASAEDFERVGLTRSGLAVPLEFTLGKNARGEAVIQVTTREAVREPYIGFLIEANWPKGRLLREYTLLLDPPTMAPAIKGTSSAAVAIAAREPERAMAQPLPEAKPAAAPAARPAPAIAAAPPAARPVARPTAPARTAIDGEYGPVAAGETLTEIARATRVDESISVNQMMVALLRNNPDAFYKDNINALKRGAVLRVPSAEEIAATGSARDAAIAVRSQIDEWRGISSSAAPARVVSTGTSSSDTAAPSRSTPAVADERLALVPPRAGDGGEGAGDRRGGSGSSDAAAKAELNRLKESLSSREQESSDLKSRLQDLEDLKAKNDRLIALQNSELAELRNKLKDLQAAEAASPGVVAEPASIATAPVAEVPAVVAASPNEDIWGKTAVTPEAESAAEPELASAPTTPESSLAGESAEHDGVASAEATHDEAAASPEPVTAVDVAPPAASPVDEPMPVVADNPVQPVAPASAPEAPWYMQPWVLGAAGLGALLLVLLGLRGRRKPEPKAGRGSIAGSFGASPLGATEQADTDADLHSEEEELIAAVHAAPNDAEAHLQLLSLYYAERDAANFEAAAEEMYAVIGDPNRSEWHEVRAMGEELCPHSALFGGDADLSAFASHDAELHAVDPFVFEDDADDMQDSDLPSFADSTVDFQSGSTADFTAAAPAPFGLNLDDLGESLPPPADTTSGFSFDDLPELDLPPAALADSDVLDMDAMEEPADLSDLDFTRSAESVAGSADDFASAAFDVAPAVPAALDMDDSFAGIGDAVDTKLDLARAYLDLGDADAARAMLDEVIAEGSAMQQDEARKLIAEIG